MSRSTKAKLAGAVIAAVAVAGGGVALAAATGKPDKGAAKQAARSAKATTQAQGGLSRDLRGPGDRFAAAATYLGLTQAQIMTQLQAGKTLAQIADATQGKSAAGLIDALVKAEQAELAAAVTANRLTQAQADSISANLKQRVTDLVNGTFEHGGPGGFDGHGPGGPGGPDGWSGRNGPPAGFSGRYGPPAGSFGDAGAPAIAQMPAGYSA